MIKKITRHSFFSARHPNSPSQPDANISAFEPKFPDVSSKTRIPAQRRSRSSGKTGLEDIICFKYIYFVLYRDTGCKMRKFQFLLQIIAMNHFGACKQDKKETLWFNDNLFRCQKGFFLIFNLMMIYLVPSILHR